MTCFEIMHVPSGHEGHGLWTLTGKEIEPAIVQRGHPIYKQLRSLYDLSADIKRPRRITADSTTNERTAMNDTDSDNIDNND
jgi:hypothetical protein